MPNPEDILEITVRDDEPRLPWFWERLVLFDPHFFRNFRKLWHNRHLLHALTVRGIRARYKQSLLGIGWALLTPAAMTVVFTYVFTRAGIGSKINFPCPFPIFALCMLTFWNFFQRAVLNGSTSLVSNMDLVTKVYFPREVLPISSVLMNLVDWCFAFLMFLALAFAGTYLFPHLKDFFPKIAELFSGEYRFVPHVRWLWTPVFLLLLTLFVSGIVFIAATMQVYFRDISHLLNLGLFLWLFLSPVLYPLEALAGGRFTTLCILNPMTGLLDGIKMSLLVNEFPWEHHVVYAAGFSVALFFIGYAFFKHEERYMADVV